MKRWHIKDDTIIEALREHGFTCERPEEPTPRLVSTPTVSFTFRSLEEQQEQEAAAKALETAHQRSHRWYDTDCPLEWGESYTLPDGRILVSFGTSLIWQEEYDR